MKSFAKSSDAHLVKYVDANGCLEGSAYVDETTAERLESYRGKSLSEILEMLVRSEEILGRHLLRSGYDSATIRSHDIEWMARQVAADDILDDDEAEYALRSADALTLDLDALC